MAFHLLPGTSKCGVLYVHTLEKCSDNLVDVVYVLHHTYYKILKDFRESKERTINNRNNMLFFIKPVIFKVTNYYGRSKEEVGR